MAYLLDANVFISAKRVHYGFDFCPGFWAWLERSHADRRVFSIERVEVELQAIGDELSDWAEARGREFFLSPNERVFPSFSVVSSWLDGQKYTSGAINSFLLEADYYLVSQAHAGSHTVVSYEVTKGSRNKVKIPEVCMGLGIPYLTPPEMLRRERARLVLGPRS